ncbi:acyl-CoA dehydrogenase family protein [Albibacterium bauzanense]|uniref:Alkylation response protein AidB-like acyl-CoA dehydrogenase n=1 Tax=Albibacterium bauzanense TaxID=653929 RepID=A0A4V2PXT3_9SPHI|nr:hypothetical protein [Albibacterium bauzanense]TCK83301.1 alkylation response protein AidB-like acyl-CoA dehydrogenase [Albibacterium bauzanense]
MTYVFDRIDIPEKETLYKEAPKAEKLGKLTSKQLDIIYQNRWFHLLVPQSIGGAEMPLPEFAAMMEKLAAIDGSFAWNVNLGAGANMFAGFMEQNVASETFKSERACVAGSGAVTGTAKIKDEGYIIDGNWKYASGSAHANYFSLNAQLVDSEKDEYASFLVPAKDVKVIDTWKVFGMKATSSCDFSVSNVWVSKSYRFDLQKPSSAVQSPLYRFPFMLLAEINMLVMTSGLAIHFYELVEEYAKEKMVGEKNSKQIPLSNLPRFKEDLNKVSSAFLENRGNVFVLLDKLWQEVCSDRQIASDLSDQFSESIAEAAKATRQLVDTLYPYLGMKVIFTDTEISRVYRDFKVASQHALLSPSLHI